MMREKVDGCERKREKEGRRDARPPSRVLLIKGKGEKGILAERPINLGTRKTFPCRKGQDR